MRAGSWALSSSWQVTHTTTITAEQWDWCLVSWQSHYNWDKELTIVFLSLSVSAGDCAHCQRDNHWFSITCEELTPGRWSGGWRVMVVPAQSDLLCNTGHWHGPQSSVRLDANIASLRLQWRGQSESPITKYLLWADICPLTVKVEREVEPVSHDDFPITYRCNMY